LLQTGLARSQKAVIQIMQFALEMSES